MAPEEVASTQEQLSKLGLGVGVEGLRTVGVPVAVKVAVPVAVEVKEEVFNGVEVSVLVTVEDAVGVLETVGVGLARAGLVEVAVAWGEFVGVKVGVPVAVGMGVPLGVIEFVSVAVARAGLVEVGVACGVKVKVAVAVAVKRTKFWVEVGLAEAVLVPPPEVEGEDVGVVEAGPAVMEGIKAGPEPAELFGEAGKLKLFSQPVVAMKAASNKAKPIPIK